MMDGIATDFNNRTGSVMSRRELEEERKKRGECVTCGRKCYNKKLFKMVPITEKGLVLNGRCLNCNPVDGQDKSKDGDDARLSARPATSEDLARFERSRDMMNNNVRRGERRATQIRTGVPSGRGGPVRTAQSSRNFSSSSSNRMSSGSSVSSQGSGGGASSGGASDRGGPVRPTLGRAAMSVHNVHASSAMRAPASGAIMSSTAARSSSSLSAGSTPSARSREHSPVRDSRFSEPPIYSGAPLGRSPYRTRSSESGFSGDSSDYAESNYASENGDRRYSEYDDYDYPRVEHRPGDHDFPTRPPLGEHGSSLDEEDARVLANLGMTDHPAAAQLLDYYRRNYHHEGGPGGAGVPRDSEIHDDMFINNRRQEILRRSGSAPFDYDTGSGPARAGGGSISANSLDDRMVGRDVGLEEHFYNMQGAATEPRMRHSFSARSWHNVTTHNDSARSLGSSSSYDDGRTPPHFYDEREDVRGNLDAHLAAVAAAAAAGTVGPGPGIVPDDESSRGTHRSLSQRSLSQRSLSQRSLGQQRRMDMYDNEAADREDDGGAEGMDYPVMLADPDMERLRAAGTNYIAILNIMHGSPESADLQAAAMQQLSDLHLSPEDSAALSQVGAIEVIVNALHAFPNHLQLQTSGCRAIWNASGIPTNQLNFVLAGALDIMLEDMDNFSEDSNLQEQALASLANLAALEANLEVMVEKGTIARILNAMTKHSANVEVQMKGCLVIANLASHPTSLKRTILEKGAGGATVISMVMHPNHPDLQEKALRALRNLSANCDENKVELTNLGAIDAVISAMQVHRDSPGVQEAGAWTLSNMAGNHDNKVLIGDCGGIDVVIRAMWVHSDNPPVLEWCCRALYTLSLDESNSRMILEVGGISAVVNSMQAHVDSAVVQEMGCAILCNLAADQQSKIRIVDEEALDAIVLAMVLFSDDVKVQERACQVILQLAIAENLKAMQASNVTELVQTAARNFPDVCGESTDRLLQLIDDYINSYG